MGWGKQISDLEVFHTVRKVLESQIEPIFSQKRPGEIDHISLDSSKAKKELNWEPKVTFEEGIRLATEYYKKLQSTK